MRLGFVLLMVFVVHTADAHRLSQSMTEIDWSPDRATLEIVHSVHLDDAMLLLAQLGAPDGELDIETQAKLMLYTESHFELAQKGQPLELEPVGAQIQGDYLWIYQERGMAQYPRELEVTVTFMHALDAAQQNQVNLRIGDHVRTLRFDVRQFTGTF